MSVDTESWTWDTNELADWICNDEGLYADLASRGRSAQYIKSVVSELQTQGWEADVDFAEVDWDELAEFLETA